MSSDEKALKPSEIIHKKVESKKRDCLSPTYDYYMNCILEYLDEQAELLETHTVKEEHRLSFYKGDEVWKCECGGDWRHDAFGGKKNTPSDKKEEKGCCDYCIGGGDHLRCPCHKKKEEPTTPEIIITGLQYKVVSQPTTPEKMFCADEIEKILVGEYNRRKEMGQDDEAFGILYAKQLLLDKLCPNEETATPEKCKHCKSLKSKGVFPQDYPHIFESPDISNFK